MRSLPNDLRSERALLGGLMQDPVQILDVGARLEDRDFFQPDHQEIYRLLLQMSERGEHIDMITVPERIGRSGKADKFGGVGYVVELPDHVPATANLMHYAGMVSDKARRRRVIELLRTKAEEAYDCDDLGNLTSELATTVTVAVAQTDLVRTRLVDLASTQLDEIEVEAKQEGVPGMLLGFDALDGLIGGCKPGDFVILAARPAMGKTALAYQIGDNVAARGGEVLFLEIEMTPEALGRRALITKAGVAGQRVKLSDTTPQDRDVMGAAVREWRRSQTMWVVHEPDLKVSKLHAQARRWRPADGVEYLIVVDYLQLLAAENPRVPREQQVATMSRGLKKIATDLRAVLLCLAQLNRGLESRTDKRPILSDLRESGSLEQDADKVIFLYRDGYYHKGSKEHGIAEAIVAKQRDGPTGTRKMYWDGHCTRFRDMEVV